eukprot:CFRG5870T1
MNAFEPWRLSALAERKDCDTSNVLRERFSDGGRTILTGPPLLKTQLLFQYALNTAQQGKEVLFVCSDKEAVERSLVQHINHPRLSADVLKNIQLKYPPAEPNVLRALFTSLQTHGLARVDLVIVDNISAFCPLPKTQHDAMEVAKTCAIVCDGVNSIAKARTDLVVGETSSCELLIGDSLMAANMPTAISNIESRLSLYVRSFPLALQLLDVGKSVGELQVHKMSPMHGAVSIDMSFNVDEHKYLSAVPTGATGSEGREPVVHNLHVVPEYYDLLKSGEKSVEGRLNAGEEATVRAGDTLVMNETLKLHVTRIALYSSIREYLATEGLRVCLPDKKTIDDGEKVYYRFYTKEEEARHGILAFEVDVV